MPLAPSAASKYPYCRALSRIRRARSSTALEGPIRRRDSSMVRYRALRYSAPLRISQSLFGAVGSRVSGVVRSPLRCCRRLPQAPPSAPSIRLQHGRGVVERARRRSSSSAAAPTANRPMRSHAMMALGGRRSWLDTPQHRRAPKMPPPRPSTMKTSSDQLRGFATIPKAAARYPDARSTAGSRCPVRDP